jgi:hypothetical protein
LVYRFQFWLRIQRSIRKRREKLGGLKVKVYKISSGDPGPSLGPPPLMLKERTVVLRIQFFSKCVVYCGRTFGVTLAVYDVLNLGREQYESL